MQIVRKQLVLASANAHKLQEINECLTDIGISALAQSDFNVQPVPETGLSFVENAILKARNAASVTGLPALADDSGIEVDALGSAPGIYSARYAGTPSDDASNLQKLLTELEHVPLDQRSARFVCVMAYLRKADDATPIIAEGYWCGSITTKPVGSGGFGYDPIFYLDQHSCTVAELSAAQKTQLSHRARALKALLKRLHEVGV